ncbi:MAG: hypothetical protein K6G40_07300 [Eubacterium sp.]|nr:hypothetical protein [Eubacterium sp.]
MKVKQILAIIGIIILVLLYGLTLFFAVSGYEKWYEYLGAAIAASFLIPFILWLYIRMSEVFKKKDDNEE